MRVGIYNRWLATLGGGEKYSLTIAEYLARSHSVTVISHEPVSKTLAADRLNLDLSRVEFKVIPDRPTVEMADLTAEYDFFINASHMSFFPSYAPHSALLIFFPVPLNIDRRVRIYRLVGLALKRWLMVPTFDGVLNTRLAPDSQVHYVGASLKVKLPPSRQGYSIYFELAAQDKATKQVVVSLDGRQVSIVNFTSDRGFTSCRVVVPGSEKCSPHEMAIQVRGESCKDETSPVKLVVAHFEIEHPRYRLYQLLFERWLREWGIRLHRVPSYTTPILESVDSYGVLWAISHFTQRWIKKYWNRHSVVLYPPVDVENFVPREKQNQILSVGRFFAGSHNKRHDVLIMAFREMVDRGLTGWQLHLVGGVGPREDDKKYLQQLYVQAKGYPIRIHTDIPFTELVKLYGESAIYWHACGFGEDEESEPIKFEHFGITTVEAMASGCVPVVIGKGGQPEIVRHGQNGFLWNTIDELKRLTWQVIQGESLRKKLSVAAFHDSQLYGKTYFSKRLQSQLQQMGLEG